MFRILFFILVICCWGSSPVLALTIEELDPERNWRVKAILLSGNTVFSTNTLLDKLHTKERSWYLSWRKRPVFDPVAFTTDLERLQRFYEAHGYYQSRVTYDLQTDNKDALVTVSLHIEDNHPVTVARVEVNLFNEGPDQPAPAFPEQLPIKTGDIFTETAYQQGEQDLRSFFANQGHAWVQVQRKAEVDLQTRLVRVQYTVQPGPETIFGQTRVEGVESVDPELILRELTYDPGERFSLEQTVASRKNVWGLSLFRSVQITPEKTLGAPRTVLMRARVEEKAPRSIRVGLGYKTEEEFVGQLAWQHRNWLGGGRRLSFSLQLSAIRRAVEGTFVQPYFLLPHTRAVANWKLGQEDEETYLLNFSWVRPRLEHRFSPTLSGSLGYRADFLKFSQISSSTIRALGGIKRDGFLSGLSLGLTWDTTDDPLNPTKGRLVSLAADQAGEIWGGDYNFYKFSLEGKKYYQLWWGIVFAARLKLGFADAFGSRANVPLSERFYAGGEKSVRGYDRRRLGPLAASDDPLGGLTLIEGSFELRRRLWRELGGAVFLDFGQLSLDSYDVPINDLKFAPGFGASYITPIGPLRLDIGFPLDPPRKDASWRVHFSVGQFF